MSTGPAIGKAFEQHHSSIYSEANSVMSRQWPVSPGGKHFGNDGSKVTRGSRFTLATVSKAQCVAPARYSHMQSPHLGISIKKTNKFG